MLVVHQQQEISSMNLMQDRSRAPDIPDVMHFELGEALPRPSVRFALRRASPGLVDRQQRLTRHATRKGVRQPKV